MFGCASQRCEQQTRILRQTASMQRAEELRTREPHRSSSLPYTVCAFLSEYGHICVLVSVEARGHVWVSLLRCCSPNPCPLLRQGFLTSLELTNQTGWSSKPQRPTCLCVPSAGFTNVRLRVWFSYMDARDGTRALVYTKQVLC